MSKDKKQRSPKPTASQIVMLIFSVIIVLSMVLSLFINQ